MASLRNIRFLVVDDNPHMLQIVRAVLNGFDCRHVLEVRTADDAMSHLREHKADIVILDIQLEDGSGMDLLADIRAAADISLSFMPVIMLTAHSELAEVQAARDAGANEFCNKPLVPSALFQRIVAVIEKPRPFVRVDGYFGPDRRRKTDVPYRGPERRTRPDDSRLG